MSDEFGEDFAIEPGDADDDGVADAFYPFLFHL
ncbi:MAG: hypothetical protein JWR00_2059 [Rubritepida sp.]|nr:hypothetical protein [Rubritepida sp.]